MIKLPIYMDNQATTRVDDRVVQAMLPCLSEWYGNAASVHHTFGLRAAELVAEARAQVADSIGAQAEEIIFTSGATESDNLAIKGVCQMYREKGNHVITCATEHRAVLDVCRRMEQEGFQITVLPVDAGGLIDAQQVAEAIRPETILVSIMAANNEIGVIHPIAAIGKVCHEKKVLFHCDAAQAAGKIPLDVQAMDIDLMSLSAHKMYGPKGIGALYLRKKNPRARVAPMMDGGGHERGLRSGTLPVPAIVGFGKACVLAQQEMAQEAARLTGLRGRLKDKLFQGLPDVVLNGHPTQRLPGNLNISFAHVEAQALLDAIGSQIAVSSGSACTSANPEPSYVLKSIGLSERLAACSIRFGLGRFNTKEEVDWVADTLVQTVRHLREESPLAAMAKMREVGS